MSINKLEDLFYNGFKTYDFENINENEKKVKTEIDNGFFFEIEDKLYWEIKSLITKFTFDDLVLSLFIISSWLPNRSSSYKFYIINSILKSLKEVDFNLGLKLDTYEKFKFFNKKLIKLFPEFPWIEDIVINGDMGEIKYFFDDKIYSVFYNGDYTCMYEYYYLFDIVYKSSNNLFISKGLRPKNDFIKTFQYIEKTLEIIRGNNDNKEIENGYIEIPTYKYWGDIRKKFFELLNFVNSEMNEVYRKDLDKPLKNLEEINMIYNNGLPNSLFFRHKNSLYPLFSRNIIVNLLIAYERQIKILNEEEKLVFYKNIKIGIANYIHERFYDECLKLIQVFNIEVQKEIGIIVYDFAFVENNELNLFFTYESDDFEKINDLLVKEEKNIIDNNFSFIEYWGSEENQAKVITLGDNIKKINFYNIYLNLTPEPYVISTENINFNSITLTEFTYIFDEIEKLEEVREYRIFLHKESKTGPIFDRINIFANFKSGNGEIIKGAEDYSMIFMATDSADSYRYDKLKEFYEKAKYVKYGHPREWLIDNKNIENLVMFYKPWGDLTSRINIGNTIISISIIKAHFQCDNNLIELGQNLQKILSYYFLEFKEVLEKEDFFKRKIEFLIKIFPETILTNLEYNHLSHLKTDKEWNSDFLFFERDKCGIRILFNIDNCIKKFLNNNTQEIELEFFLSILEHVKINNISEVLKISEQIKDKKTKFKMIGIESVIPRKDIHKNFEVDEKYFVRVRKEMAILAKVNGMIYGEYKGKDSLDVLYKLRSIISTKLFRELEKYDKSIIEFFLEELDKTFFKNRVIIEHYNNDDVYRAGNHHIEEEEKFLENHKVFTFIIENKLFINKYGQKKLDSNEAQYIYALTKWLVDVYNSIEQIYNSINDDLTLYIEENLLFYFKNSDKHQEKNKEWEKYIIKQVFTNQDVIPILEQDEQYYFFDEIDKCFFDNYGFKHCDFMALLYIMSHYNEMSEIIIKLTEEEFIKYLRNHYKEMNDIEIKNIINYCQIDKKLLGSILVNSEFQEKGFIPYDEKKKRPHRLIIKPIIKIDEYYYLSRELCSRAFGTQIRYIKNGVLPYINEYKEIRDLINKYSKKIQDELVNKGEKIALSLGYNVNSVMKEVDLRTKDKLGNHPRIDLIGDYDLLIFDEIKNIIFNVECKYISQDFCGKDLKNNMEQVLGRKGSDRKYYIKQFLKRQEYLEKIANVLTKNLGFNFLKSEVKVIPIFLTYTTNIFLKNPPIESNIVYLTIGEFEEYLKKFMN
jgi:hypothetical protein